MKVTEIVVSAGRTFNHPHENYSNLRPQVTVKATLGEDDDWESATKLLQAQAERMVEDHKISMLASLEELHNLTERQQEVANLEAGITRAQKRLQAVRDEFPQLALAAHEEEEK